MPVCGPQLLIDWRHVDAGDVTWKTDRGKVGQWDAPPPGTRGQPSGPYGIRLQAQTATTIGPLFALDQPWERQYNMYFATAMYEAGVYRAWYSCIPPDHLSKPGLRWRRAAGQVVCYAESDDGFNWRRPSLGISEFDGQPTNIVYGRGLSPNGFQSGSVFKDPTAPPGERYKLFYMGEIDTTEPDTLKAKYQQRFGDAISRTAVVNNGEYSTAKVICGAVSPDGLHWTPIAEPLMIFSSDTLNNASWNPKLGRYVGYLRLRRQGRRIVVRAETTDFRLWPELPRPVLEAPITNWSATDDVYTNAKTLYPGTDDAHLMFPGVFHRFEDGRDIYLASSSDDQNWQWLSDRPVVERGPAGAWNGGDLNPGIGLVPLGSDRVALPIMGYDRPHKFPRGGDTVLGQCGWATWQKGRLSALVAEDAGQFSTPKLTFDAAELSVNLRTRHAGQVLVELRDDKGTPVPGRTFAEADPIAGDDLDRRVTWRGEANISACAGRPVSLGFRLRSAELFAFEFVQ